MDASQKPNTRLLRRAEAAEFISTHWFKITTKALATMASRGSGGPVFQKACGQALYSESALDSWARSKLSRPVTSTAELAHQQTAA